MAASFRLGRQLSEILGAPDRMGAQSALVGALALSPHKVVRATQDREYFKLFERECCSMNSSDKFAENRPLDAPIIAEGGEPHSPSGDRDPFEALDDLMCVVEALTPTWPPRGPMREGEHWLL